MPPVESPLVPVRLALRRLSAVLRRHSGLGTETLVAVNLAVALLDLQSAGLSVMTVLGLCTPWLLLLTRKAPWPVTVLVGLGMAHPLSVNLFSGAVLTGWLLVPVAVRRRMHGQVATLLCFTAVAILLAWQAGHDITPMLRFNITALIIGLTVGLALRRLDARVSLSERNREEALRSQRALIARELHDTLARANTQMVLRAQQAQARLHDPSGLDQVAAALEDIIATGHQSVSDLRTMLRVLRADEAMPAGPSTQAVDLPTALARAARDLRAAGLRTVLTQEGDLTRLSPSLTGSVVHILNESVANMIKYAAHDAQCTIQLEVAEAELELLVINPLAQNREASASTSSSLGLIGIRERAHTHNGTAAVTRTDHQWILHVRLPLDTKEIP